jgi:predicted Fe-Mo cluster-binding NifX family protein
MKIAVPVENDNLVIETRTGQAYFFAIFENENFIELIPNPKHEHQHHSHDNQEHLNQHKNQVLGIKDCQVIIVRMVGDHMANALEEAGIEIVIVHQDDGETADVVVKKYLAGEFE